MAMPCNATLSNGNDRSVPRHTGIESTRIGRAEQSTHRMCGIYNPKYACGHSRQTTDYCHLAIWQYAYIGGPRTRRRPCDEVVDSGDWKYVRQPDFEWCCSRACCEKDIARALSQRRILMAWLNEEPRLTDAERVADEERLVGMEKQCGGVRHHEEVCYAQDEDLYGR